jgi:hypothetical protein
VKQIEADREIAVQVFRWILSEAYREISSIFLHIVLRHGVMPFLDVPRKSGHISISFRFIFPRVAFLDLPRFASPGFSLGIKDKPCYDFEQELQTAAQLSTLKRSRATSYPTGHHHRQRAVCPLHRPFRFLFLVLLSSTPFSVSLPSVVSAILTPPAKFCAPEALFHPALIGLEAASVHETTRATNPPIVSQ